MSKLKISRYETVTLILAAVSIAITIVGSFISGHDWFPSHSSATLKTPTFTGVPSLYLTSQATITPHETTAPFLFVDYFEHGISPVWQGDRMYWKTNIDGKAIIVNSTKAKLLVGDLGWKNYTINFDVTSSEMKFSSYLAAIILRYRDEQNYVEFVVNCDSSIDKSYTAWIYFENGVKNIDSQKSLLCKPYHVKIEVDGSIYSAYLDNNLESSFSNNGYASGLVGILSGDNGGNGVAAFDNFIVLP